MSFSYDVDPDKPETWVNHPAPNIPKAYKNELKVIGGVNTYGESNLIFEWGQTAKRFFAGEQRILYTDDRIEPVIHNPVDGKAWAEFIGQPLWFVSQWRPAHLLDTPANWAKHRYGWFEDPVTKLEQWRDLLGEYPERGRYDAIIVVGRPVGREYGHKVLKYRPIGWDVIEHIRKLVYRRDTEKPKSIAQHVIDRYDEQAAKEVKQQADLSYRIKSELWPHRHRFNRGGADMNLSEYEAFKRRLNGKRKSIKATA